VTSLGAFRSLRRIFYRRGKPTSTVKWAIVTLTAVGIGTGLASCSSSASPSSTSQQNVFESPTTTTPDQAMAANIGKIISPENVWVHDAENDADYPKIPSIYENATSTAQSAVAQLRAMSFPPIIQKKVDAVIAELQRVPSDSAQALPKGADISAITQTLQKDQFSVLSDTNLVLDELGSRSSFQNQVQQSEIC
jgi:hypothetical protein